MSRLVLGFLALLGCGGCNLIFGLEEPTLASGGGATGGEGGASGGGDQGGGGGGGGDQGGGGAAACPDGCDAGCFEGVCEGHLPVSLGPGGQISCVVVKSGSVWCVGSNRFAGLGIPPDDATDTCTQNNVNGAPGPCSFSAVRVPGLPGKATQVSTGLHAACALIENGELWCWGRNDRGQTGHPPDPGDQVVNGQPTVIGPQRVEGIPAITGFDMSETHVCAAAVDGGLWCWGANDHGQLANGEVNPTNDPDYVRAPAQVDLKPGVAAYRVSVSTVHSCVIDQDREVSCWGRSALGELGGLAGDTPCAASMCVTTPTVVSAFDPGVAFELATPTGATCFVDGTDTVQCAGTNGYSFLGTVSDSNVHDTPVAVALLGSLDVATVTAGPSHLCARTSDGAVWCWGGNFLGQIGVSAGDDPACYAGLACRGPAPMAGLVAKRIRAAGDVTLAVTEDDRVVGWGMNQGAQLGHEPGSLGDLDCDYYAPDTGDVFCNPVPHELAGLPSLD